MSRYTGALIQVAAVVCGSWYSYVFRRLRWNDGMEIYFPIAAMTGVTLLANLIWNSRFDARYRARHFWLWIGFACYLAVLAGEPFLFLVGPKYHFSGVLALVPLLLLIAEFTRLQLWSATAAMSLFTAAGTAMFVSNSLSYLKGFGFTIGWLGS